MSLDLNLNKILIIDFGSQFTQLIVRRIRELGVYSELVSHKKIKSSQIKSNTKGIIFSGGPLNVYQLNNDLFDKNILKLDIPILGICFGHQILADCLGAEVIKNKLGWELGSYKINLSEKGLQSKLFNGFSKQEIVYESHQDTVINIPSNLDILASSKKSNQSFSYNDKIYGVQFHPEFSKEVTRKLMDLRIENGVSVDSNVLLNAEKSSLVLSNFLNIIGVN